MGSRPRQHPSTCLHFNHVIPWQYSVLMGVAMFFFFFFNSALILIWTPVRHFTWLQCELSRWQRLSTNRKITTSQSTQRRSCGRSFLKLNYRTCVRIRLVKVKVLIQLLYSIRSKKVQTLKCSAFILISASHLLCFSGCTSLAFVTLSHWQNYLFTDKELQQYEICTVR